MTFVGIVVAAGAGTRFGGPKALARTADGEPWVARAVTVLMDAGCSEVLVALGAARDAAAALVPPVAQIVDVPDWGEGLSASLRAVLAAAAATDAVAALIIPVDTPELPASACRRVLTAAAAPAALARAVYDGAPGHPALIGRAHWDAVAASITGDRGAGPYLAAHGATVVECGDLWHGRDVDVRNNSS